MYRCIYCKYNPTVTVFYVENSDIFGTEEGFEIIVLSFRFFVSKNPSLKKVERKSMFRDKGSFLSVENICTQLNITSHSKY